MKILDLFCGVGGWSIPFVEDGDEVIGIDIIHFKEYPGRFLCKDIYEIDGKDFQGYNLIIGSPPCQEFSKVKDIWKGTKNERNVERGLKLIYEFERIVKEANPEFWAMENVKNLFDKGWYKKKPSCFFRISKGGYRCLWSNFDIQIPDFPSVIKRNIWRTYGWNTRYLRAKIPYKIARFVTNKIKERAGKIKKDQ